jgi:hypothetical protein
MAEFRHFVRFFRMFPERSLVPEEDSHRAPKQLIFRANQQRKITDTINSTNTSSGKGWTCSDSAYLLC